MPRSLVSPCLSLSSGRCSGQVLTAPGGVAAPRRIGQVDSSIGDQAVSWPAWERA